MAGIEPARLTPLPPQDSVSTNSTTSAQSNSLTEFSTKKSPTSDTLNKQAAYIETLIIRYVGCIIGDAL